MKERTRAAAAPAPAKAIAQQRSIEHAGLLWLDVVEPTVANVAQLRERYTFDALALEDVLSQIQRPKIDSYPQDEYLFLIVHFPVLDKTQRVVGAGEVDIFVGRDYVITLHDGNLRPLRRLFTAASSDEHARSQLLGRGPGYLLYRIVDALIKQTFPMLEQLDAAIARAEARSQGAEAEAAVRDLASVQQDAITFQHVLAPNLAVVRALEQGQHPFLQVNQASYFGDLSDGLNTLADTLSEQHATIARLRATLDSLALQRTHTSVRLLLVLALALLPAMLIAAVFGMNLELPVAQNAVLFPIALLLMIVVAIGSVAFARYKQWI
jgi:magnesium transporter